MDFGKVKESPDVIMPRMQTTVDKVFKQTPVLGVSK